MGIKPCVVKVEAVRKVTWAWQHTGAEPVCTLCGEVLLAGARTGEGGGKGSSLLSSLSGAVKTATRAVKAAVTLDDPAESSATILRPWYPPSPSVRLRILLLAGGQSPEHFAPLAIFGRPLGNHPSIAEPFLTPTYALGHICGTYGGGCGRWGRQVQADDAGSVRLPEAGFPSSLRLDIPDPDCCRSP
jgi:hypothetical protein